ncbi:MAG: 16S rRNA (adenine(1518)-N(6)/adenine(1519)-N(6))-dimethyltransferase RsmA [Clostridia bacterium]|nr:16S rRNA (adenine(1518)-N(6)/adenine(1519)-N(6))-dimethyltransferase RsmA [Clostridia bacterium]
MSDYNRPSAELRARVALEKHGFHTTHSLGQNFLLSESLLGHLLDAAEITPGDRVLEIGPGAGVMTSLLAERAERVLAVELDRGLEPVLSEVLEGVENVEVVYQDAMKADLRAMMGEDPYRVVANLPYYITSDVLVKLATAEHAPESVCIMVQKEAAERVMSAPGSKSWCAMAATVRFYGEARVLEEVPPEAFNPPPHVMSCFMRIDRHSRPPVVPKDRALFLRLINAAFAMRRKTLANNLKAGFGISQEAAREILLAADVDERVRGEALDLEALCRVADALAERLALDKII